MPLQVAVFLVASGLLFGFLFLPRNGVVENKGGISVVAMIPSAHGAEVDDDAALNVQDASFFALANRGSSGSNLSEPGMSYSNGQAMIQDFGASVGVSEGRSEVLKYIIQKGDTLPSMASYFGISKETILASNPSLQSDGVKVGEVIKILPTSGVLYETQVGDTLSSIANVFNASQNDLLKYNPSVNFSSITPGVLVVVPNDGAARAALVAINNI